MNPTLNPDETTGEVRLTPRVVLGLAVMLAGLVLALDSLGFVEGGQIFRFWPLILVAVGVVKWMSPVHQKMSALIWVVAGVAFLLHTLNRMSFGGVWAMLLFFVGANIAWKALRPAALPQDAASVIDLMQFMGGTKTVVTTQDFKGGQATAVMGGCEIDLSRASIESAEVVLNAFAVWGGIEIRVPTDWTVESRGVALMGAFEDTSRRPDDPRKKLVVTGYAVMGGVEIKN